MGEEGERKEDGAGVQLEEKKVVVVVDDHKEEKVYPPPVLSHDEVIRSPVVFMDALRRFHSAMGTRFMIPVIGGKELDLHLLYVEVTQRGGLEKVIGERRWREVISAFKFPPTTTSASFVLRKYYISLLHHFEQVYFFGLKGPLVPPAAILQTKSPASKLDPLQSTHQLETKNRKRTFADLQSKVPLSFTVTGTINAKFDHGYLVTVKMGSETLHGVLYHAISHGASSSSITTAASNAIVPYAPTDRNQRRRRKGWRSRDPGHPKPNRSAYNFFFAKEHSKLKVLYPHREREFSKMIGESWNKLTEEERMVYHDCGVKDKERYRREMQEYKERLKLVLPMEVVRTNSSQDRVAC